MTRVDEAGEFVERSVVRRSHAPGTIRSDFGPFVGEAAGMRSVYDLMERVGPSSAPVLITGASGTGKELAAHTLHRLSSRRDAPFLAVNCAAIPETLAEGELFGHEKGAFTGASQRRAGYFELADGGTLFLDELSAMPVGRQTKLLRVLEGKSFRRLRGTHELEVDVRVIAAMSSDPLLAVRQGRLRADLYYRLSVVTLDLPELRDRLADIPKLAHHFVVELNRTHDKFIAGIDEEALQALIRHPWPGNVRELRNVIERAVLLTQGDRIGLNELPEPIRQLGGRAIRLESGGKTNVKTNDSPGDDLVVLRVGTTLEEASRRLISKTLHSVGNNKTRAAEILGVSTKTIYNKVREWSGETTARPEVSGDALAIRVDDAGGRVVPLSRHTGGKLTGKPSSMKVRRRPAPGTAVG